MFDKCTKKISICIEKSAHLTKNETTLKKVSPFSEKVVRESLRCERSERKQQAAQM
ncbi:MAG: hypothetical protein K2M50_04630 [Treponemataceae bacterium]|nr:hypothetical protein [Treponemataceae bacterium]